MNSIFETERLFLKPTTKEDAAFVFKLMNTPNWLKNIGDRNIISITSAERYLTDTITSQFERLGYASFTRIRKGDLLKISLT